MQTQTFSATITSQNGKKALKVKNALWWQNQINEFREGEEVTLYLTDRKPKRTDAQNRYYNLYLRAIGKEIGHTRDELHEYFRSKFLTEKIVNVFGQPTRVRASTTDLNKAEFSEYIDNIAAECGVAPPPLEI